MDTLTLDHRAAQPERAVDAAEQRDQATCMKIVSTGPKVKPKRLRMEIYQRDAGEVAASAMPARLATLIAGVRIAMRGQPARVA